jgi:hypothetical protein
MGFGARIIAFGLGVVPSGRFTTGVHFADTAGLCGTTGFMAIVGTDSVFAGGGGVADRVRSGDSGTRGDTLGWVRAG